jgi:hypothetical protein
METKKDARPMRRRAVALIVCATGLGGLSMALPSVARADDGDKRARAAEEYDAGSVAFKKKDYEKAAAHYEAADAAMPNAGALRQAIRARSEAGQGSRAATLALQALERYPNDGPLFKISHDTIEKYEMILHKVHVTCGAPCTLSVAGQPVPGEPRPKWEIYVDPGTIAVSASFGGGGGAASKNVEAKPGGEGELQFESKKKKAVVAPVAPDATPSKAEIPPEDPKPAEDGQGEQGKDEKDKGDGGPRKGISPAFFGIGAAAFVGLGIATIWSGIDTQKNPGADAVRAACQGKGTSCPEYQLGLAHQTRTNVLVGVTAATGAVTVVLGIFTNWRGNKKPAPPAEQKEASRASGAGGASQSAWEPTAVILDRGGVLGTKGVF